MTKLCVTTNGTCEAYADLVVAMIRDDQRTGTNERLRPEVKWSAKDDVRFVHSPAEVNALGHGDEFSLVRAVGGHDGFAVAVSKATGGCHIFLVKETHDFSHAGNPILAGEIIDPAVERGYNGGRMLPMSYYQGAFIRRIWPHGKAPQGHAPESHARAHATYDHGAGTSGPLPAPASPEKSDSWIPIPHTTDAGGAVVALVEAAKGLAERAVGDEPPAHKLVKQLVDVGATAKVPEAEKAAKSVAVLSEVLGQNAPETHANIVERIAAGPAVGDDGQPDHEGHDRLVSGVMSLAQACPQMVPDEVKRAALDHCAGRMSPRHLAALRLSFGHPWSAQWDPTPPPDLTLRDDVRRAHDVRGWPPRPPAEPLKLPPGFGKDCLRGCKVPGT